jgi:hypothetical protein
MQKNQHTKAGGFQLDGWQRQAGQRGIGAGGESEIGERKEKVRTIDEKFRIIIKY